MTIISVICPRIFGLAIVKIVAITANKATIINLPQYGFTYRDKSLMVFLKFLALSIFPIMIGPEWLLRFFSAGILGILF